MLNCATAGTMPSHSFPKNQHMREKWMANIILKPHKDTEINKLRVCYKHFKEKDYIGNSKRHRLIGDAVPSMLTSTETCEKETNTVEQQEANIQQETITVLQENTAPVQMDVEKMSTEQEIVALRKDVHVLSQQQEAVAQVQINVEELSQQQEKQGENISQLQKDVAKLSQMQVQMQAQLLNQIQVQEELGSLKTQLCQNSQARRPNLAEITRKKNLSPTARKFYDSNIKLQAQKRSMKKIMYRENEATNHNG